MYEEKKITIQINGSKKGQIPYIKHEHRPETIERAKEEIGLEREYRTVFIPEKLINFIME